MNVLINLVLVVQVLSALGVIGLVLLQHGKGADMGAAFGGGASGSVFGATGSANFLSRTTGILAAVFFVSTLVLAYFGSERTRVQAPGAGLMESTPAAVQPAEGQPVAVPVDKPAEGSAAVVPK